MTAETTLRAARKPMRSDAHGGGDGGGTGGGIGVGGGGGGIGVGGDGGTNGTPDTGTTGAAADAELSRTVGVTIGGTYGFFIPNPMFRHKSQHSFRCHYSGKVSTLSKGKLRAAICGVPVAPARAQQCYRSV